MTFREALPADIAQLHKIRMSVNENTLPDPSLISAKDYEAYLTERGKGWVCSIGDAIVGFAITDLQEHNVWALFIYPEYEHRGIGRALHDVMLEWYFSQTHETIWLGTGPSTRAEAFYIKCGWDKAGSRKNGELKFEMPFSKWRALQQHDVPI